MTIVGARPQFIKAAPLSIALSQTPDCDEVMVHTGQHYDALLSDIFFKELDLPHPKYNLETGSGRAAVQMANILTKLDAIIEIEKPDIVVVFGDTNSTAAAAITAAKNHIPLAHVEAGLREWNKSVPEEINKLLTDSVTDIYFCPTKTGISNLKKAGIRKNVYLTGDIGIDLLANNQTKYTQTDILKKLDIKPYEYYFMTCHRAANTDNPKRLKQILEVANHTDAPVIFPIHPRTQSRMETFGYSHFLEKKKLNVIKPLGFWDTQVLIHYAKRVLTDSGGVIKEAYFHKVPCVIMDTQIEWVEAIEEGWAKLAGADTESIVHAIHYFDTPSVSSNFLGDGKAAGRIVNAILGFLKKRK
jgi:UDP-GlcNAc3NAcA epimerase